RATVAAHPLDRQPFQGRPSVGGIPLLTRGDQRRDEAAGLQELPLEARRDRTALLGGGESKIQRGRGRQGGPVRHARPAAPPQVVKEPPGGIIRRGQQGPTTVGGSLGELPRDVHVTCPPPKSPQR